MKHIIHGSWTHAYSGYAAAVLRVATGLVFAMHGYQKLSMMGIEGTAGFLASLGFPMATLFAVILIAVELLGGIALILGVWTYWAASLNAIVALVALLSVHLKMGFFISNGGYEFILLLLAATISIMLTGPGKLSLGKIARNS